MKETTIMCGDTLSVLWSIGWLFTIGYLRLSFWKGVLALIIWPYYMGIRFSPLVATEVKEKQEVEAEK